MRVQNLAMSQNKLHGQNPQRCDLANQKSRENKKNCRNQTSMKQNAQENELFGRVLPVVGKTSSHEEGGRVQAGRFPLDCSGEQRLVVSSGDRGNAP